MAKASSRVFFCMSSMATSTGVSTVCGVSGACTYGYVCLCWGAHAGACHDLDKPPQGSWNRDRRVSGHQQCWRLVLPWVGLGTLRLSLSSPGGRGLHLESTTWGPYISHTQFCYFPNPISPS